jgi:hypothetical protein
MATGKEKDKANETDRDTAPVKSKAKAKPKEEKPAKEEKSTPKEEKGVLATAAEAIGSALGTIVKTTGIAHLGEKQVSQKIPKLQKKNKQRVPRKVKKKAKKALGSPAGK